MTHIPRLRAVPSVGPIVRADGEILDTPCAGCQFDTQSGQRITKYRRSWWHETCAERDIQAGNPREAWLALGHDLARSPGSYRVKETRSIVGALLGMIHNQTEEEFDSTYDFSPPIGGSA